VRGARDSLVRGTRIRMALDRHERAEDDAYDRLAYLPSVSRRSRRFLGPLQDLVIDG
jgi:hypothetical protein